MCEGPSIIVVVSGIFALGGIIIGALLTRRTEHEKWLRQERSVVFAEFLRQLSTVVQKAIPILSGLEPKQQQDSKVTDLFLSLQAQEYIVRLYLPATDRESFSKLTEQCWLLLSPRTEAERRVKGVDDIRRKIQSLFEGTIDGQPSPWSARPWKVKKG